MMMDILTFVKDNSVFISIVATPLLTGVLTSAITWFTIKAERKKTEKHILSQENIADRQIRLETTSKNRQAWINDVRDSVALYLTELDKDTLLKSSHYIIAELSEANRAFQLRLKRKIEPAVVPSSGLDDTDLLKVKIETNEFAISQIKATIEQLSAST